MVEERNGENLRQFFIVKMLNTLVAIKVKEDVKLLWGSTPKGRFHFCQKAKAMHDNEHLWGR